MATFAQRQQLGTLIVAKRQASPFGWTQAKLADEAKINGGYLSLIERGERQPSLDTLHKLRKALMLTEGEFLHWLHVLEPQDDPKAAA